MTIKAIETRYAGCHFRSRLEARWAVFLDARGIRWEYEPQGFELPWRLSQYEGTFRYLPDFWLPELGLWFEVKGTLDQAECERLLNAAAALSSNNGGGCRDAGGHDLVLAGPIPRIHETPFPVAGGAPLILHLHKGTMQVDTWIEGVSECGGDPIAFDVGGSFDRITAGGEIATNRLPEWLLLGGAWYRPNGQLRGAIEAARSARFEHGRSGR